MKQPPPIEPAPTPGPDYDPIDWIVQGLENIESFLDHLSDHPDDLAYLNKHLTPILAIRRSIWEQIEALAEEPYDYPHPRLQKLHEENEQIFIYLEGAVGAVQEGDKPKLKKCIAAVEEIIFKFDDLLTP